jgi:putative SOS response-associated peptidase YedK
MCGRIVRESPVAALAAAFDAIPADGLAVRPRWNLCPGDDLVIVVQTGGTRRMGTVRWGFVPAFARDPERGPRSINARAESVATRPAFRDAFRRRRCVVAADGFYEWAGEGRARQPYLVRHRSRRPLALAGLWERWRPPDGPPLQTGLIITCPSAGRLAALHDRMPAILGPDAVARWLDSACGDPAALLVPFPDDLLDIHPVSRRVNSPRNDSPDLLEPVGSSDP